MFPSNTLYIEFDKMTRIAHLTGTKLVSIADQQEMTLLYNWLFGALDAFLPRGRMFLLTDLNKIRIDPLLAKMYAAKSRLLMDKYLYKDGIARYGFELTRVTILHGYRDYLQQDPGLFASRAEAMAYLYGKMRQTIIPDDKTHHDCSAYDKDYPPALFYSYKY